MKYLSNDKHLEVIQYFLADTEMNLHRLVEYIESNRVKHLITDNESELIEELHKAISKYNLKETESWKLQSR